MYLRPVLILLLAALVQFQADICTAGDGNRSGFVIGFGAGYGHTRYFNIDDGVATSFKIGGGLSEKILVYFSNRLVFFPAEPVPPQYNYTAYQGMSAVGASFFLQESAPSAYLTAEIGRALRGSTSSGNRAYSGLGLTVGVGYEFSRHFMLEATYMYGPKSSIVNYQNVVITLNWLAF